MDDHDKSNESPADEWAREADWSGFSKKLEGFVPDGVVRKAVGAFRGVVQTEEGVRTILGEVSREVVDYAREQIDKGKGEVVALMARELREFLEETDVSGEVRKILTGIQLEVTTQIRFVEQDDGSVQMQTGKTKAKRKPRTTPKKKKATGPSSPTQSS